MGPSYRNHLLIPISLSFGSEVMSTTAMIDYDATSNFIQFSFIQSLSIPCISKSVHIPLNVIDGQLLSSDPIRSHSEPVSLFMKDSAGLIHSEVISLNVFAMSFPVVLGMP